MESPMSMKTYGYGGRFYGFTLLTLAVGLAMDAFAVSICKGLAMREKVLKKGSLLVYGLEDFRH